LLIDGWQDFVIAYKSQNRKINISAIAFYCLGGVKPLTFSITLSTGCNLFSNFLPGLILLATVSLKLPADNKYLLEVEAPRTVI